MGTQKLCWENGSPIGYHCNHEEKKNNFFLVFVSLNYLKYIYYITYIYILIYIGNFEFKFGWVGFTKR